MAKYDSADLLVRCIRKANRPTTDASMQPADWYAFLTEAQDEWFAHFASIVPDALMSGPTLLMTADGGLTYTFGNDPDGDPIFPLGHVEIRATSKGAVLVPATEWSQSYDFVIEGNKIRWPNGVSRTFGTDGPMARFITPPDVIDATTQPVLQPKFARTLLVSRAVAKWARRGGMRDPQPFLDEEQEAWLGNPESGVMGILGALRTQFNLKGVQAIAPTGGEAWWRGVNTGAGYSGS